MEFPCRFWFGMERRRSFFLVSAVQVAPLAELWYNKYSYRAYLKPTDNTGGILDGIQKNRDLGNAGQSV